MNRQEVIEKIIEDSSFREQLLKNPKQVCEKNGIEYSKEIEAALKGLTPENLKNIASVADSRYGGGPAC